MAKGIGSGNSLKALAHPVQQFLAGWGVRERPVSASGHGTTLPAPYELAALRGEGILRQRFFGQFMTKLPVELDAGQQLTLWQTLVDDGGYITAWVQRLGIAKALRREAVVPEDSHNEARKLYCLLLDALERESPALLPWAVEGYFYHCWRERFPHAPVQTEKPGATQTEVLRERLTRALRKRYGEPVEIKESFREESEAVKFSLLAKRKSIGRWETLVALVRPRLKIARLAAYDAGMVLAEGMISDGGCSSS